MINVSVHASLAGVSQVRFQSEADLGRNLEVDGAASREWTMQINRSLEFPGKLK